MDTEGLKQRILAGEVSLRELSKQTGIDREKLKDMFLDICTEEEKVRFREILKENKKNGANIKLEGKIKEIVIQILKGEITARKASEEYGIDRETLRRKAEELANSSPEYIKYYIGYKEKRGDYSGINFRRLFVEMIDTDISQSEMAAKYGLQPRTISRELEKLKNSEDELDRKLYQASKIHAENKMKHREPNETDMQIYEEVLEEVKKHDKFITIEVESETEKRLRELEEFECNVESLRSKGLTNEQIAKEMGVGVSTVRRRALELREAKNISNLKNENNKQDREQ